MPGDPEECRARALRCEAYARTVSTPEAREHFINLAETWRNLATEVEAAQRFLDVMEAIAAEAEFPPLKRTSIST